jgi:hypothetical protein
MSYRQLSNCLFFDDFKMIFDKVHLLIRIRIRIHNLKLRIRILQKVSDPYGSGFASGSTTLVLFSETIAVCDRPTLTLIRALLFSPHAAPNIHTVHRKGTKKTYTGSKWISLHSLIKDILVRVF